MRVSAETVHCLFSAAQGNEVKYLHIILCAHIILSTRATTRMISYEICTLYITKKKQEEDVEEIEDLT